MSVAEIGGFLESAACEQAELLERARWGMNQVRRHRLGGECWGGAQPPDIPSDARAILVLADPAHANFNAMFEAAVAERGGDIVLFQWLSSGSLRRAARWRGRGCRQIDRHCDPWRALERVHTVYTTGHEIGFLALLAGKKVRAFGDAFYTGFGLTNDDARVIQRPNARTLESVFAAVCILGARYVNPFSGQPCGFEEACGILAHWRRVNAENRKIASCVGMSIWKRQRIRDMLRSADGSPRFVRSASDAVKVARKNGGGVAVWASREPRDLAAAAAAAQVPVYRVEDGFLRSVGLGANFTPAASLVIDGEGIYFDPTSPSALDRILNSTAFEPAILDRARELTRVLVKDGITKYNVGGPLPRLDLPADRRAILVPGQVENDGSVELGGAGITRNIDLLRRVRAENLNAFILYKPHPDVEAGHRPGAVATEELLRLADLVVRDVAVAAILSIVDEVHTLTSLAGFEALLRGKRVIVYGQPFYSGWGLTEDRVTVAHRTRRLTIDELVAGALIVYPRYLDPVTRRPCGPELVIERLNHAEYWRPSPLTRLRRLQGAFVRKLSPRRSLTIPSAVAAPNLIEVSR